ncbi:MAG: hypothetical protein NT007_00130 [Candidatus Kapabacteria bacterium]|nr:hypothetical protein [Candidatus Kapabacteria bacterium]
MSPYFRYTQITIILFLIVLTEISAQDYSLYGSFSNGNTDQEFGSGRLIGEVGQTIIGIMPDTMINYQGFLYILSSNDKIVGIGGSDDRFSSKVEMWISGSNPASDKSALQIKMNVSDYIEVKIFDILGKEKQIVYIGYLNKGLYPFVLKTLDYESGSYTIILKLGNLMRVCHLIVYR